MTKRKPRPVSVEIYRGSDGRWHGWLTVGTLADGRPDRRHRSASDQPGKPGSGRAAVEERIRALETELAKGDVSRPGTPPTVSWWLNHWLTNVADVRESTQDKSYGWAIKHLTAHLGSWRLAGIRTERLDEVYRTLRTNGLSTKSVHLIHGTLRAALNEAVRRQIITNNPALHARLPRLEEKEIEPLTVRETQQILQASMSSRNGARWSVGLALGLRQGEVLGLRWSLVDLDEGYLRIQKQAGRRKWRHGCKDPHACARKRCNRTTCRHPWQHGCDNPPTCTKPHHRRSCPGHGFEHRRHSLTNPTCPPPCNPDCTGHARACPRRVRGACSTHPTTCPPPCNPDCTGHARACPRRVGGGVSADHEPKGKASKRRIGIPEQLVQLLRQHRQQQREERIAAGSAWNDNDLLFPDRFGNPVDAKQDWLDWKQLLAAAGIRDARVHDARHTTATLLLLQGVDQRTVMDIMGWSNASMVRRYQHVVDELRSEAARRVGTALWGAPATTPATSVG